MSENIHQEISLRTTSPAALQTSRYLHQLSENLFQGLKKQRKAPKPKKIVRIVLHPQHSPVPLEAPGPRSLALRLGNTAPGCHATGHQPSPRTLCVLLSCPKVDVVPQLEPSLRARAVLRP